MQSKGLIYCSVPFEYMLNALDFHVIVTQPLWRMDARSETTTYTEVVEKDTIAMMQLRYKRGHSLGFPLSPSSSQSTSNAGSDVALVAMETPVLIRLMVTALLLLALETTAFRPSRSFSLESSPPTWLICRDSWRWMEPSDEPEDPDDTDEARGGRSSASSLDRPESDDIDLDASPVMASVLRQKEPAERDAGEGNSVLRGRGEDIINRPRDRSKQTLLRSARWAVIRTRLQELNTVAKERDTGGDCRQPLELSGMMHARETFLLQGMASGETIDDAGLLA